jgi:hypothetical protein
VLGGLVGGHLFVGWAVHEDVHLGARGMGAKRFPDGFYVVGGPSISGRVYGPLWLGATFLLGTEQHTSDLVEAKGSVPPEFRAANNNEEQVNIGLDRLDFSSGEVDSGFMFGGSLEISVALVGPDPHAAVSMDPDVGIFSGALMLGIWPGALKAPAGFDIVIPGGISYRFH